MSLNVEGTEMDELDGLTDALRRIWFSAIEEQRPGARNDAMGEHPSEAPTVIDGETFCCPMCRSERVAQSDRDRIDLVCLNCSFAVPDWELSNVEPGCWQHRYRCYCGSRDLTSELRCARCGIQRYAA